MAELLELTKQGPSPVRGALVGLAAGLAGAAVMSAFQSVAGRLAPKAVQSQGDPATVKTGAMVKTAITGRNLATAEKPVAGALVHYGLGGLLGIAYGVAAEYQPEVTSGDGTAFGEAVALILDEAIVPAAGLAPADAAAAPLPHLFGLASHAVFGRATETVRAKLTAMLRR